MSTMPAGSRILLLIGIAINLVVFSLNHIVGVAVNHGDYTPFAVVPQVSDLVYDETQLYAPGPSRFLRTGQVQAELDVFELRGIPNSYPVLHSILLGLIAKATGSLESGWMLSHAIMPSLIWAVLFWNACRIVQSGSLAMAIAWVVCFISFSPRNFLLLAPERFIQPLELSRMPQPALAFLFLILAIWLLSRALARPALLRLVAAGITAGTLFYLYYFYWIAFFVGAGSLLLVAAIIKRWDYAKALASVLVLGCLTGIPFLFWTFEAMHSGHQRDLMARVGIFTRRPRPDWAGPSARIARHSMALLQTSDSSTVRRATTVPSRAARGRHGGRHWAQLPVADGIRCAAWTLLQSCAPAPAGLSFLVNSVS